jgi:hypothetical protein
LAGKKMPGGAKKSDRLGFLKGENDGKCPKDGIFSLRRIAKWLLSPCFAGLKLIKYMEF